MLCCTRFHYLATWLQVVRLMQTLDTEAPYWLTLVAVMTVTRDSNIEWVDHTVCLFQPHKLRERSGNWLPTSERLSSILSSTRAMKTKKVIAKRKKRLTQAKIVILRALMESRLSRRNHPQHRRLTVDSDPLRVLFSTISKSPLFY